MAGALTWLLVYLAAWLALTLTARGRRGRWEVSPLAVIYRLPRSMEPIKGSRAKLISRASYASIAVAYGLMGLFYYLMTATFWARYVARVPGASSMGVVPLIPGVTVPLSVLPHFLLSLGIAAAVHELAHAVAARAEGLRVKSVGIAVFVIVPAAFVELDENELSRAPLSSRLKVYSAGVTANIILYAALLALTASMPCSAFSSGVSIVSVEPGSPASHAILDGGVGLARGDVIVAVNGEPVRCIGDLSRVLGEAGVKTPSKAVNLTLTIERGGRLLEARIFKPANTTRIGVTVINKYTTLGLLAYSSLLLNFALALVNAAPLFITDGARMLDDALSRLSGGLGKAVATGIQAATLLMLLSLVTVRPILPG